MINRKRENIHFTAGHQQIIYYIAHARAADGERPAIAVLPPAARAASVIRRRARQQRIIYGIAKCAPIFSNWYALGIDARAAASCP